jgi:xanthine dehydrogenase accessory factor
VSVPARPVALIKGAGDLATGVAVRLHRAGFDILMTELDRPTAVRRSVAFAEAVFRQEMEVEGIDGRLVSDAGEARATMERGLVAVLVDPDTRVRAAIPPLLLVDAILAKRNLGTSRDDAPAVVALGPGFVAGEDCHAVVETMRGHTLGRVLYQGAALSNTGVPGEVGGVGAERVLRAPAAGFFRGERVIGDRVRGGDRVATVESSLDGARNHGAEGTPVIATVDGVLRGLLHDGVAVTAGFKVGDIDPRASPEHCFTVSDKAWSVAGGVLEAACHLLGGVRL